MAPEHSPDSLVALGWVRSINELKGKLSGDELLIIFLGSEFSLFKDWVQVSLSWLLRALSEADALLL